MPLSGKRAVEGRHRLFGQRCADSSYQREMGTHCPKQTVGSTQVSLTNSIVSDNWRGFDMWDSAGVSLLNSTVSSNEAGLSVKGSAQVSLTNSTVSRNWWGGLYVYDLAKVEVRGSTIVGNGTHTRCSEADAICEGLAVRDKAVVELRASQIQGNADWGVAAGLKQCGYDEDDFTGKVTFQEMGLEDISGNSTTNNQKDKGNPGNHPWNRPEVPDVPDGQVCLL